MNTQTVTENWYGIAPTGTEIMISHDSLMKWASDNDAAFQVGWSHHFVQKGNRLVRGSRKIATAREQGWNDLADKLISFGFEDTPTP